MSDDRRLSDVSRGKPCADELLKRANSCRVSPWTADTVDEILIGDAMYMKAFDDDRYRNTVADVFTRSSTLAYDDC